MDHQHAHPRAALAAMPPTTGTPSPAASSPPTPHPSSGPGAHRSAPARSEQPVIAVVGGSLTGPVTALLLLQAGFEQVRVYEAAASSASLGGGVISLEHAALDVLDRLGVDQAQFVTCSSESILQITVSERTPARTAHRAYPGRFTTWTALHAALSAHVPEGVICSRARVTGLDRAGARPLLRFADGQCHSADLVVFADGRASTGRRLLDPARALHYAGYVAHRGCAPAPAEPLRHFLRFEPGPGVQFNIAPVPGGSDWTFYLNASRAQYTAWFGAGPEQRVFALPAHVSAHARAHVDENARDHLPAEQARAITSTTTRMAVPVMDIEPPAAMVWPVAGGHAVLLGDALAPVRAHTGRGANNGIEQAAGLVAALTQHRKYRADLDCALTGWQRRHLPAAIAALELGPAIGERLGLGTH